MSSLLADGIPPGAQPSLPAASSTLGPMGTSWPVPSLACNPSSSDSTWQGLTRKITRVWHWKRFPQEPLNSLSPVGQKSGCTEVLAVGVAGPAGEGQGVLGPVSVVVPGIRCCLLRLADMLIYEGSPRFAARPGLNDLIEHDKIHQRK